MSVLRTGTCGVMLIGSLACGHALATVGIEPPAAGPTAPVAPTDPSAEFAAWFAEHKGEIETIAGAKFTRDVPVKVIGMDDLAQIFAKSIEAEMAGSKRANGAPMSEMEIHVRATAAAFKVAMRTFGLYRREDKTVYVMPENVKMYAKKYGWSEETAARLPRLAMAHEMVHALQDQKAGLSDRLGTLVGEERGALMGVSEGQAVWVTDQLAKKLDWGSANAVMWGVVAGTQTDDEPAVKGAGSKPGVKSLPSAETYTLGKAFVEHHAGYTGEGLKGAQRVWAILAHPPTTMEQLKAPEKFEVKAGETPAAPGAPSKP